MTYQKLWTILGCLIYVAFGSAQNRTIFRSITDENNISDDETAARGVETGIPLTAACEENTQALKQAIADDLSAQDIAVFQQSCDSACGKDCVVVSGESGRAMNVTGNVTDGTDGSMIPDFITSTIISLTLIVFN